MEIVEGNILNAHEKYICHQTNCVTNHAAHLAKAVFTKFPFADIYNNRQSHDKPGTIIVKGDGVEFRFVVNMLGQVYPGKPKYPESSLDGTLVREEYFHRCLIELSKLSDLQSVAFPFNIGCGAAGGDWNKYQTMLSNFSNYVLKNQGTKVVVYKLPSGVSN
jgi:hypothetical protein